MKNFVVIDTEGKDTLTEIAVVNCQGERIYEAFIAENQTQISPLPAKPLVTVLNEIAKLVANQSIVCHYAQHEIDMFKKGFAQANLPWQPFQFICSYELTKIYFPQLKSYSLTYLSKYFGFKVENHYYSEGFAHRARYDADFTYLLYLKIMEQQQLHHLRNKPNPFSNSRVDTPFQVHPDLKALYQQEFHSLTAIIEEIKVDTNHQSKGAVIIGEPGSGKTHLIMRLAQEVLCNNRLLFIRQPNNPHAVVYHIYSRILESFVENVPETTYSQLEYLLAKSFSNIVIQNLSQKEDLTKKDKAFKYRLSENPLDIYNVLGSEGTDVKRKNWEYIEKQTLDWWHTNYGFGGHASEIIKGLIKFCTYTELYKRELVKRWLAGIELEPEELAKIGLDNWGESLNQEDFSLEAIAVFGKLSMVDEPLILVFDQLEGLKYQEELLVKFGEAIKEIFTHVPNSLIILNLFPDRWEHFQRFFDGSIVDRISQYKIMLSRPDSLILKNILVVKTEKHDIDLSLLFTEDELQIIFKQPSIRSVLNCASDYYRHKVSGVPLPKYAVSFEEEVRAELKKLTQEISAIKQQLNLVTENISLAHNVIDVKAYIRQQHELTTQNYHKDVIITDTDDIGKLRLIFETFQLIRTIALDYLHLGKKQLPEHILVKLSGNSYVVGFLQIQGSSFTTRMRNINELVAIYRDVKFGLYRDERLSQITGKVGLVEVDKFNNAPKCRYKTMDKVNRVTFEAIYKVIVDVQNQEVEFDLLETLNALEKYYEKYWLIKVLNGK